MIKIIIIVLLNVVLLLTFGDFMQLIQNMNSKTFSSSIMYGLFVIMAIFQVVCVPCIYLRIAFSKMLIFYFLMLVIAEILAVIYILKSKKIQTGYLCSAKKAFVNWTGWKLVAIGLIALQVIAVTFFSHTDADDASFIAIINTTLETNTMLIYSQYTGELGVPLLGQFKRALSPFQIFQSVLAFLFDIHPAILCHTLFPCLGTIFLYIVHYKLGKKLFIYSIDKNTVWKYLLFVSIFQMYGNYFVGTSSSMALLRIWQGKAFFAAIIIPSIFLCLLNLYTEDRKGNWLTCFVIIFAGTLTSNISFVATPIFIFAFILTQAICQKKIRLIAKAFLLCTPCWVYGMIELVSAKLYGKIG